MGKVEGNAEVRAARLFDRQQAGGDVRENAVGARLVGFVFNADVHIGRILSDFPYRADRVFPDFFVVGLKAVIKTILPHPQCHQAGIKLAPCIDAALGQLNCFTADLRIGMGKGADFELRRIPAHLHTVDRKACISNRLPHGRDVADHVLRIVEIKMGQAVNRSGAGDHLQHRWLALEFRPVEVCPRGKGIQTRSKFQFRHEASPYL